MKHAKYNQNITHCRTLLGNGWIWSISFSITQFDIQLNIQNEVTSNVANVYSKTNMQRFLLERRGNKQHITQTELAIKMALSYYHKVQAINKNGKPSCRCNNVFQMQRLKLEIFCAIASIMLLKLYFLDIFFHIRTSDDLVIFWVCYEIRHGLLRYIVCFIS